MEEEKIESILLLNSQRILCEDWKIEWTNVEAQRTSLKSSLFKRISSQEYIYYKDTFTITIFHMHTNCICSSSK